MLEVKNGRKNRYSLPFIETRDWFIINGIPVKKGTFESKVIQEKQIIPYEVVKLCNNLNLNKTIHKYDAGTPNFTGATTAYGTKASIIQPGFARNHKTKKLRVSLSEDSDIELIVCDSPDGGSYDHQSFVLFDNKEGKILESNIIYTSAYGEMVEYFYQDSNKIYFIGYSTSVAAIGITVQGSLPSIFSFNKLTKTFTLESIIPVFSSTGAESPSLYYCPYYMVYPGIKSSTVEYFKLYEDSNVIEFLFFRTNYMYLGQYTFDKNTKTTKYSTMKQMSGSRRGAFTHPSYYQNNLMAHLIELRDTGVQKKFLFPTYEGASTYNSSLMTYDYAAPLSSMTEVDCGNAMNWRLTSCETQATNGSAMYKATGHEVLKSDNSYIWAAVYMIFGITNKTTLAALESQYTTDFKIKILKINRDTGAFTIEQTIEIGDYLHGVLMDNDAKQLVCLTRSGLQIYTIDSTPNLTLSKTYSKEIVSVGYDLENNLYYLDEQNNIYIEKATSNIDKVTVSIPASYVYEGTPINTTLSISALDINGKHIAYENAVINLTGPVKFADNSTSKTVSITAGVNDFNITITGAGIISAGIEVI